LRNSFYGAIINTIIHHALLDMNCQHVTHEFVLTTLYKDVVVPTYIFIILT